MELTDTYVDGMELLVGGKKQLVFQIRLTLPRLHEREKQVRMRP